MADAEYDAANGASEYQEQPEVMQGGGEESGGKINASKNDDESRKIFVGGLSWETTVKELREYFEKFGEIADCTIKTDPETLRSRGFGFVLFNDSASVDQVINQGEHTLHGRHIDPKKARARGGRGEPIKKIFVGGLDPETPEADIRDFFQQYGKIEEIDLPFDKIKNQRRAFIFITFESEAIADAAVVQPKQTVGGKEVDVKKATPKNEQGGFGGRGGRGGFGDRGGGRGGRGGRGRGGGGDNYDYNAYYNQGYGQGYGGYDYSNYYNNYYNQGGWGNQGYGSSYPGGNYDQQQGGQQSSGYHPYQR